MTYLWVKNHGSKQLFQAKLNFSEIWQLRERCNSLLRYDLTTMLLAIFLPYCIYHISTSIDFTNLGLKIIGLKIIPKFTAVNRRGQGKSFLFYTIGISESATKSSIRWYVYYVSRRLFRIWVILSFRHEQHICSFWEIRNSHLASCKIYNADLVERLSSTLDGCPKCSTDPL